MKLTEHKKVKDFLDKEKFITISSDNFKLSFSPRKVDKQFRQTFKDILEMEVTHTIHSKEGVILCV